MHDAIGARALAASVTVSILVCLVAAHGCNGDTVTPTPDLPADAGTTPDLRTDANAPADASTQDVAVDVNFESGRDAGDSGDGEGGHGGYDCVGAGGSGDAGYVSPPHDWTYRVDTTIDAGTGQACATIAAVDASGPTCVACALTSANVKQCEVSISSWKLALNPITSIVYISSGSLSWTPRCR